MIGNFKHQLCRGNLKHVEKGGLWLAQPKLDGMRVGIFKRDDQYHVFSRNLKPQPFIQNYRPIIADLEASGIDLTKRLVDGEVTASTRFEAIGLSHRQYELSPEEKNKLIFIPFDILRIAEGQIADPRGTNDRLNELTSYLSEFEGLHIDRVETINIHSVAEAHTYYGGLVERGMEGAVLKQANAPYKFGNSQYWVKMKADFDEDLTVLRTIEGVGKFAGTLGAFVVNRGGLEVHVGSFQIDDTERNKLWAIREELVGKTIEVRHFGATPAGSLSHPIFVCVRWDR